jgi:hypothetical protein
MVQQRVGGLIVGVDDGLFIDRRDQIFAQAARHAFLRFTNGASIR